MPPQNREQIFNQWLSDHHSVMQRIARSWTRNPEDRDDLLQEILLQVFDSVLSFQQRCAVETWLYRIALRTAMRWSAQKSRRPATVTLAEDPEVSAGTDENPRLEWLYRQLQTMPEADRSLMVMLLDGLSNEDISDVLGISAANVAVRSHRIRRSLGDRFRQSKGQ